MTFTGPASCGSTTLARVREWRSDCRRYGIEEHRYKFRSMRTAWFAVYFRDGYEICVLARVFRGRQVRHFPSRAAAERACRSHARRKAGK